MGYPGLGAWDKEGREDCLENFRVKDAYNGVKREGCMRKIGKARLVRREHFTSFPMVTCFPVCPISLS